MEEREEFRFAGTGTVVAVVLAEDAVTVLELELEPGAGAERHRHTREDETIVVVEGALTVSGRRLEPWQAVHLPVGVAHDFRNEGDTVARALVICVPGGLERFFRALASDDPAAAQSAGIESVRTTISFECRLGGDRQRALASPLADFGAGSAGSSDLVPV